MRPMRRADLDTIDEAIISTRLATRERIKGPRVGDMVQFKHGETLYISHLWPDDVQTSVAGSFYLKPNGEMAFSGQLNHGIPRLGLTRALSPAEVTCWFFHHDQMRADNGLQVTVAVRMFATSHLAPR
jgi:hypothetical protein